MNLGYNIWHGFKTGARVCIFFVLLFLAFAPLSAFAGAWLQEKGKTELTSSIFYSPTSKWVSGDFAQDSLGNTVNDKVANNTGYKGLEFFVEYGLKPDITLVGDLAIYYYNDNITAFSSFNNETYQSFSISSDYFNLDTSFGPKVQLAKTDYSSLSAQFLFYPGNLVIKDKIDYIQQRLAFKASLLYGQSFNIPFGMEGRPNYGNYIDLEASYKPYPISGHHEAALNATLGLRPFNNNTLLIVALYNTFNGYSYTRRPFSKSAINADIDSLGLPPVLANSLRKDIAADLVTDGSNPYFNLNFQIGFNLNKDTVLYLKSFHNVIQNKPFTYNSFYISLENKF